MVKQTAANNAFLKDMKAGWGGRIYNHIAEHVNDGGIESAIEFICTLVKPEYRQQYRDEYRAKYLQPADQITDAGNMVEGASITGTSMVAEPAFDDEIEVMAWIENHIRDGHMVRAIKMYQETHLVTFHEAWHECRKLRDELLQTDITPADYAAVEAMGETADNVFAGAEPTPAQDASNRCDCGNADKLPGYRVCASCKEAREYAPHLWEGDAPDALPTPAPVCACCATNPTTEGGLCDNCGAFLKGVREVHERNVNDLLKAVNDAVLSIDAEQLRTEKAALKAEVERLRKELEQYRGDAEAWGDYMKDHEPRDHGVWNSDIPF